MDIFVQSRGEKWSQEYTWVKNNQKTDEPSILHPLRPVIYGNNKSVFYITHFYDCEQPSIIVVRSKEQLLLLLTGIKAEWDAPGGAIYHSVAWLSSSKSLSREENVIRKLIIRALDDRLQNEISSVITATPENEHGFYINISRLEQLEKDESLLLVNGKSDDHIDKIGTNNEELKADLIKELTSQSLLQEEGVLIVVSDFVTKEVFREAKVWRGLSGKLKNEAWEAYEREKKSPPPEESWRRKKLILVMLFLVAVILAVLLIGQSQRENPLFNPQHPQKEQKQTEKSEQKEQKQAENPVRTPPSQHQEQSLMMSVPIKKTAKANLQDYS
ncbi:MULTISPECIES: hypothetical protein [unclassified Tolypothrix]|uniref:hypothetical protein n=1 Tax=unclassified Tolypothrix TaxID=2649714 RepID=UPI0005EAB76C|nr:MULTISPECIES: hypothetical protein [unclassified Tolypothrix]BAY91443.1 hypothetical protein NIES3275_34660 [Microchaete diplosiphon NIES-3275]EKF05517.1 hypothetical protein FDUTEX481_01690 [Tolypothrix sp. PCC 7601]MBE9086023.1 hypothetical protein [Tolypothrix sp. LEGE 11397]UYD25481.1 hypothetical protein HGR01_29680 [Tolypothrix sp. PCC 7712]UYD32279.1 hypothetical protein HG267_24875 [Tolypothrix sp. PCC 7601]